MSQIRVDKSPAMCEAEVNHQWLRAAEAYAVELVNRIASATVHIRSLFELLTGKIPNILKIKPFGCANYAHSQKERCAASLKSRAVGGVDLRRTYGQHYFDVLIHGFMETAK